jgi:1-deoxy-D-xylulose-5-phosphate synthase
LGLRYIGPVEGHDVGALIDTFNSIKNLKGPTLVHVITRKGKGYKVAEEKADVWHGASPFDIATGQFHKKTSHPTYTDIFADAMIQLAGTDERIIGLTAAMPDGTGISKFGQAFPERTFDVGMAEQHCVGFAGALSLAGFRPVAAIYSTFLQRAYDQVIHDVCLMNLPVTFAMDRAGIVGEDGPTHQGMFDIAYLRTLPNIVVMAPKDENELRHMLKTAVYHPGPAAVRYPRGAGLGVPLDPEIKSLEIGKAELLKDGGDLAIFAYGHMAQPCAEAAAMLEKEGIDAALVNARFAKPVDAEMVLKYARSTGCMVTVEEHSLKGGFGSAVLETLEEHDALANLRVKRIGVGDIVVEHGAPKIIRENLKLDAKGLFETIVRFYRSRIGEKPVPANVRKALHENGKKEHHGNGGKKSHHRNGKKGHLKDKQPVIHG